MKKIKYYIISLLVLIISTQAAWNQKTDYILPEAVMTELNRLDETYQILDQFSTSVWDSWNDYMDFPFLFEFPNGLRVLVGHPAPPSVFIPYPGLLVRGRAVSIDINNLNNFVLKQPLYSGGGPLTLGTYENKPVTIVHIRCATAVSSSQAAEVTNSGERNIIVYIHELMHCSQPKILRAQFGNLRINPDLNLALYAEIEGQALAKAYEQVSYEDAVPFLKDFCIARSLKIKDLSEQEKNSAASDEFREGEAVYSEVMILQKIGKGFKSSPSVMNDAAYGKFRTPEVFLSKYPENLKTSSGRTLDIYGKNYWFGCFESLLLQRYFPGWQKEVEKGKWLHQILYEKLNVNASDSLSCLKRFEELYHIGSLAEKHGTIISKRNKVYESLMERKGRTYIIDSKPISQYFLTYVDKSLQKYELGVINMFPDGLGEISFDKISISLKPVPAEISELFYIKLVDTESGKDREPYGIEYESKDNSGFYYNVTVTTPLFVLKAPKISIIESSNRVKFRLHSRV